MSTEISTEISSINDIRLVIDKMSNQFKMALPSHIPTERFVRVIMTTIQTKPELLEADRRTLYAAIIRAAQIGLLPDGNESAIVTFKGQCQLMPMIAGIQKLIRNSGELASLDALCVYSKDKFTYRPGIELVPIHEPDWFGDRGEMIGCYAVAKMKDGAAYCEIMNLEQIQRIRAVSRSSGSGPWVTWFEQMARKSVIRRLSRRLPMSTDIESLIREDDSLFMPDSNKVTPQEPSRNKLSRLRSAIIPYGDEAYSLDCEGDEERNPPENASLERGQAAYNE